MDRKKPKAPPSSYLIFCNSERENAKNAILEKLDIKVPKYDEEARLLKLKYSEDLLEWQKSLKACGFAKVKRNRKIKFSNSKIQKIMHLNSSFRKINNDALGSFMKASVLFLIEIVNKTLEYKIEKKSAQHISSLDIVSCIRREGIKYKFLEDCFYLMKGPRIRSCFLEEEEENDTSIFDLCEEDKKEYNYDIEEKKLSRMKRKMNSSRAREKMTENKTIYADISTFFKKV
ncbi:high mobility group protein B4, putative [Plasmodium ovale]|uniref:High mobility group protein B4, putative n=1 Tax=Plasmodium ovale TaxID=36330 RepID=A0A1C3KTW4_PLAOA|nr:high mobility group protein B4, putative [Plasmodium ovale]